MHGFSEGRLVEACCLMFAMVRKLAVRLLLLVEAEQGHFVPLCAPPHQTAAQFLAKSSNVALSQHSLQHFTLKGQWPHSPPLQFPAQSLC